ncbi:hypothetical protein EZS27_017142, partial [termite gut metagenome]
MERKKLKVLVNDPWLDSYENAINGRYDHAMYKKSELTNSGKQTLSDFASGYRYFGLHRTGDEWLFREWAPHAIRIYLIGTFSDWKEDEKYALTHLGNGNWEIKLPVNALHHQDLYKLKIYWAGGEGERIPAWVTRVVQDDATKIFSAQVWSPENPFEFKVNSFKPATDPLLIY